MSEKPKSKRLISAVCGREYLKDISTERERGSRKEGDAEMVMVMKHILFKDNKYFNKLFSYQRF